ncbi:hypothetical protein Namu_2738 [Nakamurella multipartita DSM 44233]|uniref:Uncharacterized protein n=1 Tax=Nakamurella multipartita (strain ATCC 700099 / DSM 44233 / CIP 104796 / JCM 9543 / NBRC 105858 / Y-104) TaxID=479431 RepID=C8X8M9_NAKMY|nr:hypothetical protein Namu_2738 [Nakamurella multipartita DSM 44233]
MVAVADASRDPDLPASAVAELMSVDRPVRVRHDTVNRGGRTVLTIAAADPNPAVRVAAHGSPNLPAAARYALSRDLAVQRLAGRQRISAAS